MIPERVLDEKVAFLINSILSDNKARQLTFGANSYLNLGNRGVAVKTGTTNDLKDNWTIGWSRDAVVGVWVGNNDNKEMKNVASGVSGAAPIWRRLMLEFLSEKPDRPFEKPVGISEKEVDKVSGFPAHDGFESYLEWFVDGTIPSGDDPIHTRIKVCKNQNDKLANAVQVGRGDFDWREAIILKEIDPLTDRDLWQKAVDGWIATKSADPRVKIPTEYCEANRSISVNITNPTSRSRSDGETIEIRFDVFSDKSIDWVQLYLDGNLEETYTSLPYRKSFSLSTGNHAVRVVAKNSSGNTAEQITEFAVNQDFVTPSSSASDSAEPL